MKKTALITGASNGIGYEFAQLLASQGTNLILVARSGKKLEEIKTALEQKYKIQVTSIELDLSQINAPLRVAEIVKNKQIDILINNAGFGDFGEFVSADWDKQMQMIQLNMTALTHLTHLFLKGMVERKFGRILNVASTAAFQPGPLMAVYYATKAFVLSFSEAISEELKGTGVTVTVLCPGPTESGFQSAAAMEESKLVKGRKMPTSREVAQFGLKKMNQGSVIAIHGWWNSLMASSVKFVPRGMVRKMVKKMQEKG